MNNLLDTMGLTEATVAEAKAEPKGEGFLLESGPYKMVIKQLAVFETASKAKMLKIELQHADDPEKTYTEYANTSYIDKKTKELTENKSGASMFKSLMSAIKLEPAQATTSIEKIKAYGKDVENATVVTNATGRSCIALIREVNDPNQEQYQDSNQVEAFADIETNINSSTEAYDKWMAKIESTPKLMRKLKSGTKQAGKSEPTEANKAAAMSLLN